MGGVGVEESFQPLKFGPSSMISLRPSVPLILPWARGSAGPSQVPLKIIQGRLGHRDEGVMCVCECVRATVSRQSHVYTPTKNGQLAITRRPDFVLASDSYSLQYFILGKKFSRHSEPDQKLSFFFTTECV